MGHDAWNLAVESGKPNTTAGHFSKGLELILSLQVGKPTVVDRSNEHLLGDANAIHRYVGLLQFRECLVQGQPAEVVDSRGKDQAGFLAIKVLQAVRNIDQSIENI